MGTTKTEFYSPKHNDISILLKAYGHPARVSILEYLIKTENCICGDIVKALPLAQPTVSQHIRELRKAGLIRGCVNGKSICYCVNDGAIKKLEKYFKIISSKLSDKSKCI